MDIQLGVQFDQGTGLQFTQGEDRTILMSLYDVRTLSPVNLTGASDVGVNIPLAGGGSIKRNIAGLTILSTQVVIPSAGSGYIGYTDHGLVTGDPIQVAVVSGGLPAPLAILTNYLVKTIDANNFYITDTSGNTISLTTQGTGSFTVKNSNDVVIAAATLGQVTLSLRNLVTLVVNPALAQTFQVEYVNSGKTRVAVLANLLDCYAQPVP